MYNLTPSQQALLRSIVEKVRAKQIPEEFTFAWDDQGAFLHYEGAPAFSPMPEVTKGALDALAANNLLHIRTEPGDGFGMRYCTLTGEAYKAVDSNFAAPDTSFVRHLTPLADITAFDSELKHRCFLSLEQEQRILNYGIRQFGRPELSLRSGFAMWE